MNPSNYYVRYIRVEEQGNIILRGGIAMKVAEEAEIGDTTRIAKRATDKRQHSSPAVGAHTEKYLEQVVIST